MTDPRAFYDQRAHARLQESGRWYHRLLEHYFALIVPPGSRVLELGCGLGDLLAAVRPARGLGIDFSPTTIALARERHPELEFRLGDALDFRVDETFDYVLVSDLVNDLPDVQAVLERVRAVAHPRTRLVVSFFNNLWRPVLAAAVNLGAKAPTPPQNWLSAEDMRNLLYLAGWECVRTDTRILWPVRTAGLAHLINRWLAPCFPSLCLTVLQVARPRPAASRPREYSCSVIIPARNEAGNIQAALERVPEMGTGTELIFVEGHSQDDTWEVIQRLCASQPQRRIKALKQQSSGKGGAVREGFAAASGELLFILDADLTMPPEELPKFYAAAAAGAGELVNGVRLVYPMAKDSMQFLNMVANKCFGWAFSWLLGQPIKDTLCGTKVLFREDYEAIAQNRAYFGEFDPFGDFDLLFGAAKLNRRIVDLPIRYRARTYGSTNIHRWRHGWLLCRMVLFAARRLKFL